jgi:hypothetical protein
MMRAKKLGQGGVTFVELLLVMGLLGIFLVVLTNIFTATLDVQTQSQAYSATVSDGRFIMARLNYDIARATAVTTPAALGDSDAALVLTIDGSPYTYALNAGSLQLTDPTGTAGLDGGGTTVSNLSFQRLGNAGGKDTIRYSFTLTSTATDKSGADTQTFTSTAERR